MKTVAWVVSFLAVMLSGCAATPPGVIMSADEAKACKAETCTVWTDAELRGLIQRVFVEAFRQGGKASI